MFNGMNGLEILKNWPRYESGELVGFGDEASRLGEDFKIHVVCLYSDGSYALNFNVYLKGERVKRPAPKVLDADGVEIRVGDKLYDIKTGFGRTVRAINANKTIEFDGYVDRGWLAKFFTHRAPVFAADGRPLREGETVWSVKTGREHVVVEPSYGDTVVVRLAKYDDAEGEQYTPDQLTHRAPVLAADGRPLKEGETVWHKQTGRAATVKGFDRMLGEPCAVIDFAGIEQRVSGTLLTHERPVADSWERLEEDAREISHDVSWNLGNWSPSDFKEAGDNVLARIESLIPRAKALAERGQ